MEVLMIRRLITAAMVIALPLLVSAQTKTTYNVRTFGATGDGTTKDTAAFQKALDICAVNGGGEVLVPAGKYLIGSIQIGDRTILRLEKETILNGSPDLNDYPMCDVRWEGRWQPGRRGLIYASNVDHTGIIGPGQINGSPWGTNSPDGTRNPVVVEPISCNDVRWEDFSVVQGGHWATHPTYCTDMVIKNLNIRGNRDGIDVDSCKNVLIEGCTIDNGDDCISLKSGRGMDGARLGKACENITIRNCTLIGRTFACIGIGSETSGGVKNIRIEHCKMTANNSQAIYIKTRIGRAGGNENITGDDIDVEAQTFLRINLTQGGNASTADDPVEGLIGYPYAKNIAFSNVRVKVNTLVSAYEVSEKRPVEGLTLTNITGTAVPRAARGGRGIRGPASQPEAAPGPVTPPSGIKLANIIGVKLSGINVTGVEGPMLGIYNVKGTGLEGAVAIDAPVDPPPGNARGFGGGRGFGGRGLGRGRGPTTTTAPAQ
jgi:hypothetical protein